MPIRIFNPADMVKPLATYSHVAEVTGEAKIVFIAGQVAIGESGEPVGVGDFERQCTEVYARLARALHAAGGDWRNVVQVMSFLTRREDVAAYAAWRQREFPRLFGGTVYPPSTLLIVAGLAHPDLLIEVQPIAAI